MHTPPGAGGADGAAATDAGLAAVRSPDGWLLASGPNERFASLFGRDACIAALQLLPADRSAADATLEVLGRHLGRRHDPEREEQPGKVPHEVRGDDLDAYERHGWPVDGEGLRYYGSVDASLWYLILFAALARSGDGADRHRSQALEVLGWLRAQPAPLTYRRTASSGGLAHQWWRDVAADRIGRSSHGDVADDGTPLAGTVGIAAVQALAWRALRDATDTLDHAAGAAAAAAHRAFFHHYVLDGKLVTSRDGRGVNHRPNADVAVVLWTGILDEPLASTAASHLLSPDTLTVHGLRSLPASHPAFDPRGYHTGAVWPFLNWFAWAALQPEHPGPADRIRTGTVSALAALECFAELYAVTEHGPTLADEACRTMAVTIGAVSAWRHGWDGRTWLA